MKKTTAIFLCLSLGACTTVDFVRKDFSPTKQAVLRHIPASSPQKEEKYKTEIDKKAREFCGTDFQITKQYQAREPSGTSSGVGTGVGFGMGGVFLGGSTQNTEMYDYVEFACK